MLKYIVKKVCNISYFNPNQKIKINDWYTKIEPPMWMAAYFECMNVLINDNNDNDNENVTDKFFSNKPVAIG